jgi:lysophospholipase L1-like esterase
MFRIQMPLHARWRSALLALGLAAIALALLALPTPARAATYVAMGDSYSSGVGTREYHSDVGECKRSPHAYPVKVARRIGSPLTFVACSGARTQDVIDNQLGPLGGSTTEATVSIGGNDAGFASVITSCARPWPWTCWGDIDNAQTYIRNTLPGRLDGVYSSIRSRAPSAIVGVVGYPRIFNGVDQCNFASRISPGEQQRLNETADLLRDVTRSRAAAHGFAFVDPIPSFVGHAVCDPAEWINGLSIPILESYHPNRAGQDAYANLVAPAIE